MVLAVILGVVLTACVGAPEASSRPNDRDDGATELAHDSSGRRAREVTLRVRNTNCVGLGLGSGVSIGDGTVVTNHHVVDGADRLELTTWDGRDVTATVASATYVNDLAIIRTDATELPAPDRREDRLDPGDRVRIVGYPEGGQLEISGGSVVDYVPGDDYGEAGSVLRATAVVKHGNSGGPVLDDQGRLVGIVFAIEGGTDYALVIPMEDLAALPESSYGPVAGTCS
ncbi:MAG: S1C family serine protease [Acidimicrobiia bacterium]